jgi:hypothetical protein
VPIALLALPGALLGTILIPVIMRWILLIHTSITTQSGDFLGPPRRRLLWFAPAVFLFHPAPYIVIALLVASVRAAIGRVSTGWLWFLVGFYAYAVMIGFLVVPRVLALRRINRDARKA